jgi:hypothetical protein
VRDEPSSTFNTNVVKLIPSRPTSRIRRKGSRPARLSATATSATTNPAAGLQEPIQAGDANPLDGQHGNGREIVRPHRRGQEVTRAGRQADGVAVHARDAPGEILETLPGGGGRYDEHLVSLSLLQDTIQRARRAQHLQVAEYRRAGSEKVVDETDNLHAAVLDLLEVPRERQPRGPQPHDHRT